MKGFSVRFIVKIALLVTLIPESVIAHPTGEIIGGDPSQEGAWPFMSALYAKGKDPARDLIYCGGSLIDRHFILTAGHCVTTFDNGGETIPLDSDFYETVTGRTVLSSSKGEVRYSRELIPHPDFNLIDIWNDYALIRLDKPVDLSTVALSSAADESFFRSIPMKTIGWGMADPNYPVLPDGLKEGSMTLVSGTECASAYGLFFNSKSMMCAIGADIDDNTRSGSCYGDSGSPLLVFERGSWSVVGITSWGFDCGSKRFPDVYSRVSAAASWIQGIVDPVKRLNSIFAELPASVELALKEFPGRDVEIDSPDYYNENGEVNPEKKAKYHAYQKIKTALLIFTDYPSAYHDVVPQLFPNVREPLIGKFQSLINSLKTKKGSAKVRAKRLKHAAKIITKFRAAQS